MKSRRKPKRASRAVPESKVARYAPEVGDPALVLTSGLCLGSAQLEPRLDRTMVLSRTGSSVEEFRYALDGTFCGDRTVEFDWLGGEISPVGDRVMTFVWPWMKEHAMAYLTERGLADFLQKEAESKT